MRFYTNVNRYGNSILLRGYQDGEPVKSKIKFKPTVFVPSKDDQPRSGWKTLYGENVEPIQMESMRDTKEFIDKYDGIDNYTVHANTNYVSQYIAEFFAHDIVHDINQIDVGNIDLEVLSDSGFPNPDQANYPIISIAYKSSRENVYYVWGMGEYDVRKTELDLNGGLIQYFACGDEEELLRKFLARWKRECPDIITGWNVRLFDMPYLVNRMSLVLGDDDMKDLSPWRIINYRMVKYKHKTMDAFDIYGVQQLDYMDLFQKFGYSYGNQESYSLDNIAHVILGERKLSYEEVGSLHALLSSKSQNIHPDESSRNIEDMADFEKWALLRDRLNSHTRKL